MQRTEARKPSKGTDKRGHGEFYHPAPDSTGKGSIAQRPIIPDQGRQKKLRHYAVRRENLAFPLQPVGGHHHLPRPPSSPGKDLRTAHGQIIIVMYYDGSSLTASQQITTAMYIFAPGSGRRLLGRASFAVGDPACLAR
jgi:hypothetical protein